MGSDYNIEYNLNWSDSGNGKWDSNIKGKESFETKEELLNFIQNLINRSSGNGLSIKIS